MRARSYHTLRKKSVSVDKSPSLTGDAFCHDVCHLAAGRQHPHAQLIHDQRLATENKLQLYKLGRSWTSHVSV